MNKHITLLAALLMVALIGRANVPTGVAAIPTGYYSTVDGQSGANILVKLHAKIDNHTVISYSALEDYYEQTDFTGDTVWDMYSTCHFTMAQANHTQQAVCDGWNKEHSIPQSWFNEGSPMKSDLFHVYPTDARVNNFRGNDPYGEVNGAAGTGISKNTGNHARGKKGANTFAGYTGSCYEPDDEFKGDFARTYFYMCARYRDRALNSSNGSVVFTATPTDLTAYAKALFLKWHREDPVSRKEIDRNQAVYGIQNNRNPFIDYPYLVEYIWGERAGQAVDMSQMVASCDPLFVPGVSNGWSGQSVTPPSTVKHGVSWSVNGEITGTDSIAENSTIPAFPAEPSSCSSESETFVGWTDAPINGIMDDAPTQLYKRVSDMPAVTADVTYYAVFAQAAEMEPVLAPMQEEIVFAENYTNQQEMTTVTQGAVSVTFATAGGSNAPKYYSNGAAVRCYAGNTITVSAQFITAVDFVFGTNDGSNEITVNTGTFVTPSWTGLADPVVFTIGGTSGNRRISAMTVKMNSSVVEEVYSRYITTCQGTTEIVSMPMDMPARKVLVGGQIYIQKGEELYTIQGIQVK